MFRPTLLMTLALLMNLACGGSSGPATSSRGNGGEPGTASGGDTATGGSTGSGGTDVGSGGGSPSTGGTSATGGIRGTGGVPGTGGTSATGGVRGTGGVPGTGGAPAAGGSAGLGGASGCKPDYSCKPKAPNTGDYYADCVARVNQFRACVCLPPLARWNAGESCADMDAAYDPSHSAHAGFVADICPQEGNAQDECPGWGSETQVVSSCLQSMFDEGPPPTASCTGSCYETHGHFINMTNTRYTMVACGIATVNGQVTAVQDFK